MKIKLWKISGYELHEVEVDLSTTDGTYSLRQRPQYWFSTYEAGRKGLIHYLRKELQDETAAYMDERNRQEAKLRKIMEHLHHAENGFGNS